MSRRAAEDTEWELRKGIIQELYIKDDKTLKDVIETMSVAHDFSRR